MKLVFIAETSDNMLVIIGRGWYKICFGHYNKYLFNLMKSMSKLMDDTDDRSIAIPALISIFRQVSSVWQRNFGIPCVSKQLGNASD